MREEYVGALYGLVVFVHLHVEGFDFLRIVGKDDRLLEVLFNEVAFVFRSQVAAPVDRELKFVTILDGLFEYLYAFGIRESHEVDADNRTESFEETFVDHFVEEVEVVLAIVESPLYAELDEFLFEVHEVLFVVEADFRFDHPEFGQVARCVRVLGTESRSEGVDGSEACGSEFAFELSGNSQTRCLAEEVVVIFDLSVLVFLEVVEVFGSDLEHLSCAFTVAGCDERRVEIDEALLVEEGVDGVGHLVTDAEYGSEGVGTWAEVCDVAKELP